MTDLALKEVKVLTFARFRDERGFFTESFRQEQIAEALLWTGETVLQINESYSKGGVFRGFHAQWNPWQGKLVRPLSGRLVDLAVDIRRDSPTYGRVVAREMAPDPSLDRGEWMWVPPGFGHGVWFREETTIEYLCTSAWSPGCEIALSPLADDLDWSLADGPLAGEVRAALAGDLVIAEKDRDGPTLTEWREDPRSAWFTYAADRPWGVKAEK